MHVSMLCLSLFDLALHHPPYTSVCIGSCRSVFGLPSPVCARAFDRGWFQILTAENKDFIDMAEIRGDIDSLSGITVLRVGLVDTRLAMAGVLDGTQGARECRAARWRPQPPRSLRLLRGV